MSEQVKDGSYGTNLDMTKPASLGQSGAISPNSSNRGKQG